MSMRYIVVWGVLVLVWAGCGGTGLKSMDRGHRVVSSMSEEFDPLTLNDDDISPEDIRSLWMSPLRPTPTPRQSTADSQVVGTSIPDTVAVVSFPPDSGAVGGEHGTVDVSGWRVQLSAYTVLEAAEKAVEEARRRFDVPVYNEFEAPFYKIRIGDFRTEAEADKLVRRARRKGYTDAFKVRTRIVVKK